MEDLLNRITFNNDVLCGKPLIRGMRISVEMILELLAKGATEEEILEDYPELEQDDLRAALLYAHHMVARENVPEGENFVSGSHTMNELNERDYLSAIKGTKPDKPINSVF